MASLVYASSRQSEGPPISYPPTTSDVTAGTATTGQPLQRRQAAGCAAGRAAGCAGGWAAGCAGVRESGPHGTAAIVAAGSSGPISVSGTAVPSRAPTPGPAAPWPQIIQGRAPRLPV